ncbi:MAG: formate dehydrogenase subunit alpha [Dehalococcoidia bacterium]|nr:formate dehydrogenase subunit alpha [Dehalococcoidia bacterium]
MYLSQKTNTINVTIDEQQVNAREGATVLEAARETAIYIPTLCYHPSLTPDGACRLCVVEIENLQGFPTACTTPVAKDMVIRTNTPQLRELRRNIFELILAEHPQQCLTCPKNLRCELQELSSRIGVKELKLPPIRKKLPIYQDSPFFERDYNLCVPCSRCVRVCQEVRGVGAITLTYQGSRASVGTASDKSLRDSGCQFCGACVDVCPTGALIDRFSKWLGVPERSVVTTCPYCGVGCQLSLEVNGGKIVRSVPVLENSVNQGQACVKGRFGIAEFVHHPQRLTTPLIRRNGELVQASWEEALELVARKLKSHKGDQFAFVASTRCSNEENYLAQKFTRMVMQTNNIDNFARISHSPTVVGLATSFGSGAMTNSISEIKDATCILVIGSNTSAGHPVIALEIKKAVRNGGRLIVANPREIELCRYAAIWLRHLPGTDVALLMGMMRVILDEGLADSSFVSECCDNFDAFKESLKNFDLDFVVKVTGVPRNAIAEAARLYSTSKPATIIYGLGITQHSHGTNNVLALANLAMLTGNIGKPSTGVNPLREQNNIQGACDMGALPNVYAGYQRVDNPDILKKFEIAWRSDLSPTPGLTLTEMLDAAYDGKIKAVYVMGENPILSDADANHTEKALKKLEFLIVQDIFLTETARLADVVLPAVSFAEKDGTFTNTERRIQRIRQAIKPVGNSKPDWWIICELARKMCDKDFDFEDPSEIMEEIARLTPSYGGVTYERLEKRGLQWPCPTQDHPGTPILHVGRLVRGLGRFMPLQYEPPAELPDEEYPLILTTGCSLYHYGTGTMTRKVTGLNTIEPEGVVEINPLDASSLKIKDGEKVKVVSRRGEVITKAKVTEESPPKVVYMTFHFAESAANILTNSALDPIAKIPELKVCAVRIERVMEN